MRWVRPLLTTSANSSALRARDASRWRSAGIRSRTIARVAAMWIAEGKTSFDDCEAFTWSFGCTGVPRASVASVAMTSLVFMLLDVPEPVWKTSIGKCSSQLPAATAAAAPPPPPGPPRGGGAPPGRGDAPARPAGGGVHRGGRALGGRRRGDRLALDRGAGDREVLAGPLGLRPPLGPGRYPDLAHGVVLDAVLRAVRVCGLLEGHGCAPEVVWMGTVVRERP